MILSFNDMYVYFWNRNTFKGTSTRLKIYILLSIHLEFTNTII